MVLLVTTAETTGIDRYSQELAKRLQVPTIETRRYRSFKETLVLLRRLRQHPGIIHLPSQHFARYALFLRRPFIITVHDMARICFPFFKETLRERVGLRLDALGLRRAAGVIAVSVSTKDALLRYLPISEDKVVVVYNGIDHNVFRPRTKRRFHFPYILYVGSERPRKNLSTLLSAFASLKKEDAFRDLKLVKVGSAGRAEQFRQATLSEARRLGIETETIFTDYVSDEDLANYYSSAVAMVMPSLYEGFGLPVIEAMAGGCPVIASNSSSLPEVAGDAALFFAPHNSRSLAALMRRVMTEPALRDELITKGFRRARRFSWDRAAWETQQVYDAVEADVTKESAAMEQAKVGYRQRRQEPTRHLVSHRVDNTRR